MINYDVLDRIFIVKTPSRFLITLKNKTSSSATYRRIYEQHITASSIDNSFSKLVTFNWLWKLHGFLSKFKWQLLKKATYLFYKILIKTFLYYPANLRGVMRECYHQKCDSVANPDIKVEEGIEFLSLTTQALLLVVANMSGGMFFSSHDTLFQSFGKLFWASSTDREKQLFLVTR